MESHHNHGNQAVTSKETKTFNQIKPLFDSYFAIKDALVKKDGNMESAKANELLTAVNALKMD